MKEGGWDFFCIVYWCFLRMGNGVFVSSMFLTCPCVSCDMVACL
jgi:hypothetical protein